MLLWLLGFSTSFADVYWRTFGGDIKRANDDGTSVTTIASASSGSGLSIDKTNSKIYWTDGAVLKRANLDGSSVETVLTGLNGPSAPSFDNGNNHLYTAEFNVDTITRAGLDGSGVTTILASPAITNSPNHAALDLTNNKIYWIQYNSSRIKRANLDGSGVEDLITSGITQGLAIALDVANNKMYFTDRSKLQSANLDGTGVTIIESSIAQGLDLDLASGKVYWAVGTGEIKRANLDGSSVETLFSGAGNVWNMAYMPSTPAATGASVNLLGTAPPVYFSRKLAD